MWEAIQANTRRSRLLIGLMGALLVLLGFMVGLAVMGPDGGAAGAVGALLVWLALLATALLGGERLLLASARARKIDKQDAPVLWNVVEEMSIASGMGALPAIYLIDDDAPNAFAAGRKPEAACVAVTSGLLRRLNRDELQGVVAHEMAHIRNYDIRFLTIATVMVGSIAIISDVFLRYLWWGGGGRRSSRDSGQAQLIVLAATLVVAVLAPLCAYALYYACSRKREYLADASAARFTRYPEGLASALEKISGHLGTSRKSAPRALAPLYIVNPLQASGASTGLFSTHPPTAKRVAILRGMGGTAGWVDYERAYRKVVDDKQGCLSRRTLASEGSIAARAATPEPDARQAALERGKQVTDLVDRLLEFLLVACPCGVSIKIPPGLARDSIRCTRCGREHPVPQARETARGDKSRPLRYRRQGGGWESFKCECGKVQQMSPACEGRTLCCQSCGRNIEVVD